MKRASYREAIKWIVHNDMPDDGDRGLGHISCCLIADIFDISEDKVLDDVFKEVDRERRTT